VAGNEVYVMKDVFVDHQHNRILHSPCVLQSKNEKSICLRQHLLTKGILNNIHLLMRKNNKKLKKKHFQILLNMKPIYMSIMKHKCK